LLRRHCAENKQIVSDWLPTVIGTVAVVMLFYTGNRELYMYTHSDNTSFWKMAYFMIFVCVSAIITGRSATSSLFKVITAIFLWTVGCFYYWIEHDITWRLQYSSSALPFALYWIAFAGLCGLFVVVARIFYRQYQLKSSFGKTMMWIMNVAAIITLSIATTEIVNQIWTYNDMEFSNKATITVLWSLCAFVQMWLGMRLKYKTLRIISLSLLGLVLCKLFLYDLSNVSQGAKIVAFVVLGVGLLVLSFLYQKLKKILFENDEKNEE